MSYTTSSYNQHPKKTSLPAIAVYIICMSQVIAALNPIIYALPVTVCM